MKNLIFLLTLFAVVAVSAVAKDRVIAINGVPVADAPGVLPAEGNCIAERADWNKADKAVNEALVARGLAKANAEKASSDLAAAQAALTKATADNEAAQAAVLEADKKVSDSSTSAAAAYQAYLDCLTGA